MIDELKAEIIVKAGIKIAEQNLKYVYLLKKGDPDAGAIFIKINTLDGFAILYSRNLEYNVELNISSIKFNNVFPNNQIKADLVDARILKESSIDPDCWVIEVEDKNGVNPFEELKF